MINEIRRMPLSYADLSVLGSTVTIEAAARS
jgi:hypothetical protein